MTYIDSSNESIYYFSAHIQHFTFTTLFGDILADISLVNNVQKQSQITHVTSIPFFGTIVHNLYNVNSNFRIEPFIWTLLFDGSRSKD